jgi:hypothetical protein
LDTRRVERAASWFRADSCRIVALFVLAGAVSLVYAPVALALVPLALITGLLMPWPHFERQEALIIRFGFGLCALLGLFGAVVMLMAGQAWTVASIIAGVLLCITMIGRTQIPGA